MHLPNPTTFMFHTNDFCPSSRFDWLIQATPVSTRGATLCPCFTPMADSLRHIWPSEKSPTWYFFFLFTKWVICCCSMLVVSFFAYLSCDLDTRDCPESTLIPLRVSTQVGGDAELAWRYTHTITHKITHHKLTHTHTHTHTSTRAPTAGVYRPGWLPDRETSAKLQTRA